MENLPIKEQPSIFKKQDQLLLESTYDFNQNNHPDFSSYINSEQKKFYVGRSKIMEEWTSDTIVSLGYNVCYPIIAFNEENKCQLIHISNDPILETDTYRLKQKLDEWQKMNCNITLITTQKSSISELEIRQLEKKFNGNFFHINEKTYSRFEIAVDTKKRILLTQFIDDLKFKKYSI